MKLSTKVIIFISTISLISFILIYSILKDNNSNIIEFENNLVKKNIKNLLDNIYLTSESLEKNLEIYSNSPNILKIIYSNDSEKLTELFIRDDFTHLFLIDKDNRVKKGGVYSRNSDEFYYLAQDNNLFLNINKLKKEENIHFISYDHEKILFNIININNQNSKYRYLAIGKALDAEYLSYITRLTDSYVSLIFNHDLEKTNSVKILENEYVYDIKRNSSKTLYTYLKLKDSLTNEDFYFAMNIDRLYFLKMTKNNETIFYIFVITIIFLLLLSFLFITNLFTKRINRIIKKVKEVSKNKKLKTEIKMNYNDEITYLSDKINEMFISIDNSHHEKIKKERDFLQSILDSQKSIILISDGVRIKSTNKRFNEYFDSKKNFMKNLSLLNENFANNFLDTLKKYNSYNKLAKIKINDNKEKYYVFDIKKIDLNNYIIYMNDISKLNTHLTSLKEKASFDDLTKAYNKNSILSIGKEWSKYKDFSIIILDIDFFKKINDTYGHLHGDYILRDSTVILKENLRDTDLIGRFGGEEFVIFIENSNTEKIFSICENLRKKLEKHIFRYDELKIKLTASFGFSVVNKNKTFDESFKLADKALYEAKNTGRNRTCSKL